MAPLNSPTNMSDVRISALTNAAKISASLVVEGSTIGPRAVRKSNSNDSLRQIQASSTETANSPISTAPPKKNLWKYDVWRSVEPSDDLFESSGYNTAPRHNTISLNDCRAVKFSMVLRSAEKSVRDQTRRERLKRQAKYDELCESLERVKIESTERALDTMKKNLMAKEDLILDAVRRFDEEARASEEAYRRTMEEHQRKRVERMERLKRDEEVRVHLESLKSSKNLFIVAFEKYVKTILQNKQSLADNFGEYSRKQDNFLKRYEEILGVVNGGRITEEEVSALETVCDELQQLQKQIDAEIEANSETLNQMMANQAAAEALKRQQQLEQQKQQQKQEQQQKELQQQQQQQQIKHQQQETTAKQQSIANDPQTDAVDHHAVVALNSFVSDDRLEMYKRIMSFYEEYAQSVKPLQSDENMKQFRFSCQKAVNIPLNAISSVSAQHLRDKFDKLVLILSGMPVKVGDLQVSSSAHPLGVRFCTLLVAKKMVNLADLMVSSQPRSAFPIASMIIAIWLRFPDIGNLFLAYLYKESPYLVPYFIPQTSGQTNDEYYKLIGYRYENGAAEKNDSYLKRQTGLVRLYAAMMVTKPRRGQTEPNPHGVENGWIWLVNIMKLEPLPDICATLIYEFLTIAGSDMIRCYGNQFQKLLIAMYRGYLPKLDKVDSGGPKNRLELLLQKIFSEQTIAPADGQMQANFW